MFIFRLIILGIYVTNHVSVIEDSIECYPSIEGTVKLLWYAAFNSGENIFFFFFSRKK